MSKTAEEIIHELRAENLILRTSLDRVQIVADEKVDRMTTIYAGYIMAKCGRTTIVVDPEEIASRFAYERVTRSVARGGCIRYSLYSENPVQPHPFKSPKVPKIPKKGA